MSRITDRFVVQRVDDQIVFIDDSSGQEITCPAEAVPNLIKALGYLAWSPGLLPQHAMERVVAMLEVERPDLKVVAALSGDPETDLAVNVWTSYEGPDAEQQAAHLLGRAVLELMDEEPLDGRV
jgi:hypothetical protein